MNCQNDEDFWAALLPAISMHANVHPLSNSLALMQEAFRVTVDKGFLQDFLSSSTLIVDSSTLYDLLKKYFKNVSSNHFSEIWAELLISGDVRGNLWYIVNPMMQLLYPDAQTFWNLNCFTIKVNKKLWTEKCKLWLSHEEFWVISDWRRSRVMKKNFVHTCLLKRESWVDF